MSEGLQILLFGILFQRLHHNNTKFWTKNQVLSFLVFTIGKFLKSLFSKKSLKNQEPDRSYDIESKLSYWLGVSMWLSKQNIKKQETQETYRISRRIPRNTSLK